MSERIAIVGMAATFPGAPDLDRYLDNLRAGFDAIREAPTGRLDALFHDPESGRPDRLYCRRGGFLGETYDFDPGPWGIMPVAADSADPDQLITLDLAARALEDADIDPGQLAGGRSGIVLGRGGYLTPGMVRLEQFVRTTGQLELTLRSVLPEITADQLERIRERFQQTIGFRPDASIGLVPNLAASRVANRLDLHGPAYTVDAACASSLLAVDQACRELLSGRCDTMLAGGVHLCNDVSFWSVFTQLGALSRNECIRPFDRRADGLLIGEGGGLVVLRRLEDAERDGQPVHAVLRGVGIASDGRGTSVMSPRPEGQRRAIEQAWTNAELDPETVGFVEAHGTATPAGDQAELKTLAATFGPHGTGTRPALGSVKSMIGHTMPAAGIAGLIKAVLSVRNGEIYPSLHCDDPHPMLAETRFRIATECESWDQKTGPRRAGVSAFGFGGINAHVVLEEYNPADATVLVAPRPRARAPFFAAAADPTGVLARLAAGQPGGEGECRIAVFDPTPERLARAARIVERGQSWDGRGDVFFANNGLARQGGKIVFLFPGIEAEFEPRVERLARSLDLSAPEAAEVGDLKRQGRGVIMAGLILDRALREQGVLPDAIAGHSIGEWAGMVAADMVPAEAVEGFADRMLGLSVDFPDVVFAALGCGAQTVEGLLGDDGEVCISHDNCPHQSIVCGPEKPVRALVDKLRAEGILCQVLPFRSGFHAPFLEPQLARHRDVVDGLTLQRPAIPLWSATTAAPYPDATGPVRELANEHLVSPVRFRALIEALYADGFRVFIQTGPGSLSGFVEDTLRGRDHLAISAGSTRRDAVEQVQRVGAALWAHGYPARPRGLRATGTTVALRLGAPLVEPADLPVLGGPVREPGHSASDRTDRVTFPSADSPDPVLRELAATLDLLTDTQKDIQAQWLRYRSENPSGRQPDPTPARRESFELTRVLRLGLKEYPELIDHSFFRQPERWSGPAERFCVVPMTMHLELMIEAAEALVPGKRAVGIEGVRALRWLAVVPSAEVTVSARLEADSRVAVKVGEYSSGTVILADDYSPAPEAREAPAGCEGPAPIDGPELYGGRWMFHGPAYQSVAGFTGISEQGIVGTLRALPAKGSLLDGAGQLTGYWIVAHADRDRLAFPVKIDRIEFFGPALPTGAAVDCSVWVRDFGDPWVTADLEMLHGDRVWARISGWTDRRFQTDDALYQLLRYPERSLLAERRPGGWYLAREHWDQVASRELIARRFLSAGEYEQFQAQNPRRQRGWLLGRIAAKDAVRDLIWSRDDRPVFPVEVQVGNLESGAPVIEGPCGAGVQVSLAHKKDIAVAVVREGTAPGIDIERIEERERSFYDLAFEPEEQARIEAAAGTPDRRAEWMTRAWSAKEAFAKSTGAGLGGNPRSFEVTEIDGERIRVRGADDQPVRWIETVREDEYVVAVTCEMKNGEQAEAKA
ncbi:beta-ketoacyl synthase N-terminal-like domain-containing protein [Elongatibacter sediminis]|uniref:Beta-ketoacyl synthase N-terminal-like domain-containing protein n=1 Tax=Elongatibacter sediminis TaxID=3119006 RepID=A0AAW9R9J8_9GAMM